MTTFEERMVIVNGAERRVASFVSYDELVRAAFPHARSLEGWSVTYRKRGGPHGVLDRSDILVLDGDGMVVNVARTDSA